MHKITVVIISVLFSTINSEEIKPVIAEIDCSVIACLEGIVSY